MNPLNLFYKMKKLKHVQFVSRNVEKIISVMSVLIMLPVGDMSVTISDGNVSLIGGGFKVIESLSLTYCVLHVLT